MTKASRIRELLAKGYTEDEVGRLLWEQDVFVTRNEIVSAIRSRARVGRPKDPKKRCKFCGGLLSRAKA